MWQLKGTLTHPDLPPEKMSRLADAMRERESLTVVLKLQNGEVVLHGELHGMEAGFEGRFFPGNSLKIEFQAREEIPKRK